MKKIYIFAAVLALLTLSLNAQDGAKEKESKAPRQTTNVTPTVIKSTKPKTTVPTMNELLSGIKGMSSVLQATSNADGAASSGPSRAPLRINADEYTVGPFEGDNISSTSLGYGGLYTEPQWITITTELTRDEFIDHVGDQIVGFRFALGGNTSRTLYASNFISYPRTSSGFDTDNSHLWSLGEVSGQTVNAFDDIVITVGSGDVNFYSITVYNENNRVLTKWDRDTTTTTISLDGSNYGKYDLPDGWTTSQYFLRWRSSSLGYLGYLNGAGTITISSDLLQGSSSVRVVINASSDDTSYGLSIGGDSRTLTSSLTNYSWTLSPSSTEPAPYVTLNGSYEGQWHEFYLPEPIEFNVASDVEALRMGYTVMQYPTSDTEHYLYPVAFNDQSTGHNHYGFMIGESGTTTTTQTLTGWNYATDNTTFPSTWSGVSVGGSGSVGGLWFSGQSGGTFTIPSSALQGYSTVTVKITAAKENSNSHSISVNNSTKYLTEELVEYTWENVNATSGISIQYSDWYVNMSSIQVVVEVQTPNYVQQWWTLDYSSRGDLAVQLIFKSTTNPMIEITPATQTINDATAGTLTITGTDIDGNINVSAADNDWTVNPTSLTGTGGNVNVTYTGRDLSASTTVTATAADDNTVTASATVDYVADVYIVGNYGSGWDFANGTSMTNANGTYTATLTVDAGSYILFARLLGNDNPWNTRDVFGPDSGGDWWMQGDSHGGNIDLNDDDPIYFPEGGTYRITINANDGTFTITKLHGEQTAAPTITYSVSSDGEHVTITATGNGTVTLNVPGCDPVSGEGEVSITVPCGYASNTITVTATAQETGKDESDPATAQINIPAGSDWVEMTGTYNNPNDLLSFQVIIGNDTTDIMMIDQFLASTLKNDHPDHYTYTLRQTVNGEPQTSTPVTIPVYKTSSTMQGLYTLSQVTGDTDMKLKPNVVNTEMDFDVNPDRNVLYYNLYRSGMNEYYPTIDLQHRVSQLQKYDEMVGDNVQYFLKETYASGIAPHYDRVGNEIVERLDTNWVEAAYDDNLAYVPVIWTFGLYSARGDGKNNSYGSDIKREYMGKVDATITGTYTAGNDYGTWKVGETEYCVFHPTITVTGVPPQNDNNNVVLYNDEDQATYVPYMCRAWCTYEGIHDFIRNSDGQLQDAGALPTPYWLGDAIFDGSNTATIGGEWTGGSVRDQWSFGLPSGTSPDEVTYIIRFYYKKVVTEGQQNGSKGKFIGGAAEEFFMAETGGEFGEWVVGVNELHDGIVPVDVTYVNPQGMKSSRPFDGVNIVVTRYSDGSTRTSKIVR